MRDIAERKGGVRQAWPKGAAAQMGHASKRSPRRFFQFVSVPTDFLPVSSVPNS